MLPRLICTDLDRTLVPNGEAPECEGAQATLARVVAEQELTLAFVTGRHLGLVLDAISRYDLPVPEFAICDVGTSIYRRRGAEWRDLESWFTRLSEEWPETDAAVEAIGELQGLRPQEPERQGPFKLSWYAPALARPDSLLERVYAHLDHFPARLVYSIDETTGTGLLDMIPLRAGKLAAIQHLLETESVETECTLFAGDSGNDLDVLASSIPAVLVANATDEVRKEAIELSEAHGTESRLYLATGNLEGMNGNYAAGILEGLAHYWPETLEWIR